MLSGSRKKAKKRSDSDLNAQCASMKKGKSKRE